ncbi:MAG TPA: arylsulfatase [Bacteroidetes bacterium]|nr:arylsulfatase [Bacteroidota bacterium]
MKNDKSFLIFFPVLLLAGTVFLFQGCNKIPDRSHPNVVIIFIDDQGYGDIGPNGAIDYETPNIDKLAAEGMRFTNFYAAQAVCSASRAGLLTGCYPNRIGISGALMPWSKIGISDKEMTIAQLLKQKGYVTGMVGKWHLGWQKRFLPLQHGFDDYLGLPYSNDMWPVDFDGKPITKNSSRPWKSKYPPLPVIDGNKKVGEIRTLDDQGKLTTMYTKRAVKFIDQHHNKPFFLYVAHSMVHVPLGVSDKFKGKSKQGLFGDVMMEVDWSVGEIMKALDKYHLRDNTLVIYTSDNGPWLNFGNHAGSTGGLREGKGTSWEGGQREPCIMRWPGVIPEGTICNKLSSTIDILPTLATITGAKLPDHKIDGVNILPLMKGIPNANPRNVFYYYYRRNSLEAIRKGHWKLVLPHKYRSYEGVLPGHDGFPGPTKTDSTGLALYNLRRDPGERYNVIEQHPDVVEDIMKEVEKARKDLGDDLTGQPGENRRKPGKIEDNSTV